MDGYTELQILKEEERVLVNISSRMSDQLNRLKVEELALLSQLQHQADPRSSLVSPATTECSQDIAEDEQFDDNDINMQPLKDLGLAIKQQQDELDGDEEEEEEEDDDDDGGGGGGHASDQLMSFIQHMEGQSQ